MRERLVSVVAIELAWWVRNKREWGRVSVNKSEGVKEMYVVARRESGDGAKGERESE
jgi:hypothetical protein